MQYSFYDFLMLIGSLGLFLYGMKTMSEALQRAAGSKLRAILTAMTKNRFMGVLTGLLITAIIQSSSATTVMVVSFANALLSLFQSVTVIMGANIGTTITAWIISLFGFEYSIAAFLFLLLPLQPRCFFHPKEKENDYGELILGFAFLFMGLDILQNSVPDLENNPEILQFLTRFTELGFSSVLIFLMVGTVLTVLVQSSSATMVITLVMVSKGWISYELGVAMVLGENIGTTITANIAAIPANVSAKRTALFHTLFNLTGVIWMLFLFTPFLQMVNSLASFIGLGNPTLLSSELANNPNAIQIMSTNVAELSGDSLLYHQKLKSMQTATTFGLALFHTLFNLINTFVLIGFAKVMTKLVTILIKSKKTDEEFQLRFISAGLLSTSELSLMQAWNEIKSYGLRSQKMFGIVRDFYNEENENEAIKLFTRIQKYESISDRMEVEIADYLTKVGDGRLSEESKFKLQKMLRVITEIESVGDGCYNIGRSIVRKNEAEIVHTPEMKVNIELMMNLIDKALQIMIEALEKDYANKKVLNRIKDTENEINNLRNQLRNQNILDINNKVHDYQISVSYMDIIIECEKIGDYILNVIEALNTTYEKNLKYKLNK